MTRSYRQYVENKRREYGEKFSEAGLSEQFIWAYESGLRIKVKMRFGEVMTGTIGVTTGWQPCFLLMLRSNSTGSSWTLSDEDEILAVKRGREYVPYAGPDWAVRRAS